MKLLLPHAPSQNKSERDGNVTLARALSTAIPTFVRRHYLSWERCRNVQNVRTAVPGGERGHGRARWPLVRPLLAVVAILGVLGLMPGLGALIPASHSRAAVAPDAQIRIDGAVVFQSWDGWGMSISGLPWEWTVLHYLNRIPAEEERRLQDSLFGPGGYNLVIIYTPVTPKHDEYQPQDDGDLEHYNWASFHFPYTPGDPQPFAAPGDPGYTAAAFRVIASLRSYGTTLIYNADNFPDWLLSGNELRREMEPKFVKYATALPVFVQEQLGYSFPYMIIANEPDRHFATTPEQQARLVRMTRDQLRREGLATQLIAPKTSTLAAGQSYAAALLQDQGLQADVPILATHTYSTWRYDPQGARAMHQLASAAGRRLWLTEYSDAPDVGIPRNDPHDTLDRALAWASRVQRDLTEMQVNAWFGMYPVLELGHYPADAVILLSPDYADPTRNTWRLSKRYFALAQYTQFIRPGAVRVDAHVDAPAATPDLSVVAFVDQTSGRSALVALNQGSRDLQVGVHYDHLAADATVAYRTTESENLSCLGPVDPSAMSDTGVMLQLPRQSITTLVAGPPSAGLACPS